MIEVHRSTAVLPNKPAAGSFRVSEECKRILLLLRSLGVCVDGFAFGWPVEDYTDLSKTV